MAHWYLKARGSSRTHLLEPGDRRAGEAAVATGEITPDEALLLGRLLDLERKVAGMPDAAPAEPPLTAAQREAAVHAQLAAVFGEAALAPRPVVPREPADSLHSTCISGAPASEPDETAGAAAEARDRAPDAMPAPVGPLPPRPPPQGEASTQRRAYWQGSARVRRKLRRLGMSVTQTATPLSPPSAADSRFVQRAGAAPPR